MAIYTKLKKSFIYLYTPLIGNTSMEIFFCVVLRKYFLF